MIHFGMQTPGKVESLLNWLNEDPLRGSISFVVSLKKEMHWIASQSRQAACSRG